MLGSCPVTEIIIYRVTAIKYRVVIYRFDCSNPAYGSGTTPIARLFEYPKISLLT